MKTIRNAWIILLAAGLLGGCQKESRDTLVVESARETQFNVPVIPADIAALKEDSDIECFRSGPGEHYLEAPRQKAAWRHWGRWHPVLMRLDYHLQFGPVSSCVPGEVDEAGNMSFRRDGCCQGLQSTGAFEGARGWEVMLAFITPENNPANSPYGIGMGEDIVFGWVYD